MRQPFKKHHRRYYNRSDGRDRRDMATHSSKSIYAFFLLFHGFYMGFILASFAPYFVFVDYGYTAQYFDLLAFGAGFKLS